HGRTPRRGRSVALTAALLVLASRAGASPGVARLAVALPHHDLPGRCVAACVNLLCRRHVERLRRTATASATARSASGTGAGGGMCSGAWTIGGRITTPTPAQ